MRKNGLDATEKRNYDVESPEIKAKLTPKKKKKKTYAER